VSTCRLVFGLAVLAWAPSALVEPSLCRAFTHEGSDYTVCEVDLRRPPVKPVGPGRAVMAETAAGQKPQDQHPRAWFSVTRKKVSISQPQGSESGT